MPNPFASAGMSLMNEVREDIGIQLHARRLVDGSTVEVGPFAARSSPIGHARMVETGLDISEHYRSFYLTASLLGELAPPLRGDVYIDEDGVEWQLLPIDDNHAWRWHGSDKQAYRVLTKKLDEIEGWQTQTQ